MLFIKGYKDKILVKTKYDDLSMLKSALNEVCNNFPSRIKNFKAKIGCPVEVGRSFLSYISGLISLYKKETNIGQLAGKKTKITTEEKEEKGIDNWECEIGTQAFLVIKNALHTVCEEYPGSEIHTYTGFTHDQIEKLISEMLTVLDQYNAIKKPEAPEIL